MNRRLCPIAAVALIALTTACPVREEGTDAASPAYDGGQQDGGTSVGLTVADCQNQASASYPGANAQINLVERVVTSQMLSVSAALDAFFVADPGGGPHSGILVTVPAGQVTVARNDLVDVEGQLTEFQGQTGNADTETQITATRVATGGPAPAPVAPVTIDSSVFTDHAAMEPYEGVLVRLEGVQVLPFPDGSLISYGQFQVNDGALVDDELFEYGPGGEEIFNHITGVVRYTFYGDWVILPRDASDVDSRSGGRVVVDATCAQVQNYDDPAHPEVCATTLERCNPVRLTQVVVVSPMIGMDREDDCLEDEDNYGCPYYLYGFYVADPAAVDAGGRLNAWAGMKITVTPGLRWRRGTECEGLTGQALVDCGSAGTVSSGLATTYTFAGHFQKDTDSQNMTDGFPQIGDIVTVVGEPAEYYDMTQVGRLEELTRLGSTSDSSPLVAMPLPALFDGNVETIYSGQERVPESGDPEVRPALPPGADTEKYEGLLIELQSVSTIDICMAYPYGGDPEQMTDFGYFRVAGAGAAAHHGVEVGNMYLVPFDSWGGMWRTPQAGYPSYSERTCENVSFKCEDYRQEGQTFTSIVGVVDYSYGVHRLEPRGLEDITCSANCTPHSNEDFCNTN